MFTKMLLAIVFNINKVTIRKREREEATQAEKIQVDKPTDPKELS